tara:strand:+ start:794 stop:961 length:168 start_codon:yes stop_codon:yes gene_type:complete
LSTNLDSPGRHALEGKLARREEALSAKDKRIAELEAQLAATTPPIPPLPNPKKTA